MDFFDIPVDRFPAGLRLLAHFLEYLRFADSAFGTHQDALIVEASPKEFDQLVSPVDSFRG
jgi:hypothetical protein